MEPIRFDTLTRALVTTGSRRRTLTAALAALGVIAVAPSDDVTAGGGCKPSCNECATCQKGKCKKKHGKKKCKKGKCLAKGNGMSCSFGTCQNGMCSALPPPPPPLTPTCTAGQTTCPAGFNPACCPPDFPSCCPPDFGGGCCPAAFPRCCPLFFESDCCAADEVCCGFPGGPPCCPQTDDVCCVSGDSGNDGCCSADFSVCCTVAQGGGCCSADSSFCCPPTPNFPDGACCGGSVECCDIDDDCIAVGETCQEGCCAPSARRPGATSPERKRFRQVKGAAPSPNSQHSASRIRADRFHQSAK